MILGATGPQGAVGPTGPIGPTGGPWRTRGPWKRVPWWQPRRWFGYDLMRDVERVINGMPWREYGKSKLVAREALYRAAYPFGDDETEPAVGSLRFLDGFSYVWNGTDWEPVPGRKAKI